MASKLFRSMLLGASLALSLGTAAKAFDIKAAPPGTQYPDPGVTDDEIKIGVFGPQSGPLAATAIDNLRLHLAWYDRINKMGGIWGRKIVPIVEDDKCTADGVAAAVKKLVEEDKVFMLNGGGCSASLYGIRDYVEKNKIPWVTLNAAADLLTVPPSRYITTAPAIAIHHLAGGVVDFVHSSLKKSRIALVRHDDAYGDWGQEAVEAQAKASDVSLVDVESLNANITDVTAAVLQMRAKQPDVIVLFTYPRLAALITKRAYEMGVKSTIVLAATGTADLKALADNVGNKDAFKDFYYQDTINDVPTGPKQKWVHDLFAEKYPDIAKQPGHPTDYFSNDVGGFLEVTYGLMMAGPVPTREGFVKATQTMWFETGSQAGPYILTPGDRTGGKATTFLKFDGQNRTQVPGIWYSSWKFGEKK